ncbi:GIY-YIG nuclease family protein [Patescibacteria group bacterium]|nr:GIY-YIG nuclease family protein [Patescibacteria group bacterium]MBU1448948.1 GIY-YIG nuclease family protein [Patescibacteria group bacterium]MBU2613316.1 GIY-YIG nuclease family protein [Patescibacteria group bacterium]
MYFVYVLFSRSDRKLYIGYSHDVSKRFRQHQMGQVEATKNRRPLELIYHEAYSDEQEAKRRERYLKGGNGRAILEVQLAKTLIRLGYVCM